MRFNFPKCVCVVLNFGFTKIIPEVQMGMIEQLFLRLFHSRSLLSAPQ